MLYLLFVLLRRLKDPVAKSVTKCTRSTRHQDNGLYEFTQTVSTSLFYFSTEKGQDRGATDVIIATINWISLDPDCHFTCPITT